MAIKDEKTREVITHLDALIRLAGLDGSESATEIFADILVQAGKQAQKEYRASHLTGLCLDTRWGIADTIIRYNSTT